MVLKKLDLIQRQNLIFQVKWEGLSMDRLVYLENGAVLTEGCRCAVGYHESRVQTTFSHQEGRQLAEGGVTEPFDSSFANCSKFMDTNGQIVQGLKECLNSVSLYWNMISGSKAILKSLLWLGIHHGSFLQK